MRTTLFIILFLLAYLQISATEYHVAKVGNDSNLGTKDAPFETIAQAVQAAMPGDTITVHEGIYREWINPIRGGESDKKRILYRAAPNEKVEIKGSEVITGWKKVEKSIWKIEIPHSFFKEYNPFQDSVYGDWFHRLGRVHHTGDVYLNGNSLYEVESLEKVKNPVVDARYTNVEERKFTWYCENKNSKTIIWANFQKANPNKQLTEVSSRRTCFYPEKQGINYLTIKGFDISQAATQWAAPTAEQVGMISTHWNKGWIIEDNVIHDTKCNGITLGKEKATGHNVWSEDVGNINRDGNIHYIEVIFKVLRNNWNKETVGSHIVRNNKIYNCEQTAICGSMGAVFSTIENNYIFNINIKNQFKGWEIAGIKFHAPIDMTISGNRIHNCERGIWLDWMTQGVRVSNNILYRNKDQDLFMEVNHGPYMVDNNICLSRTAVYNQSQGGAYVHNLFMGEFRSRDEKRFTPYFEPHSIEMKGISAISGGDDHFYNNIFGLDSERTDMAHKSLLEYDSAAYVATFKNNLYVNQVIAPELESGNPERNQGTVSFKLIESDDELKIEIDNLDLNKVGSVISSSIFGKSKVSKAPFDAPNGEMVLFDTDLNGKKRMKDKAIVGPFQGGIESKTITIWKKK